VKFKISLASAGDMNPKSSCDVSIIFLTTDEIKVTAMRDKIYFRSPDFDQSTDTDLNSKEL
jgi:hypothetical protein